MAWQMMEIIHYPHILCSSDVSSWLRFTCWPWGSAAELRDHWGDWLSCSTESSRCPGAHWCTAVASSAVCVQHWIIQKTYNYYCCCTSTSNVLFSVPSMFRMTKYSFQNILDQSIKILQITFEFSMLHILFFLYVNFSRFTMKLMQNSRHWLVQISWEK